MNPRLIAALLLAAACNFFFVQSLRAQLYAAEAAEQTARQGVADRDDAIRELTETARHNDLARAKLDGQQSVLRSMLADREIIVRTLQNENAEIRAWAAVAVPADVVRLHDHPAITGAADYHERLRQGQPVQPAGRGVAQ